MPLPHALRSVPRFLYELLPLLGLLLGAQLAVAVDWEDPKIYEQAAVRDLVAMVNDAARLFEKQGEAALNEFGEPGSRWLRDDRSVVIYDTDGRCLFDPTQPARAGKRFLGFRDLLGRPVMRWLVEIGSDGSPPFGWVHFFSPPPGAILPTWKSTYAVAVNAPDGNRYVIASGLYNIQPETPFVIDLVDRAVALIEQRGKDAAAVLVDQSSPYNFLGLYVYVISRDGRLVIDPAFPGSRGRNALDYQDAVGHAFVRDALERLEDAETAWVTYMWPNPGQSAPTKRLLYARRAQVGDEVYLVGSDTAVSHPIWLRY
jgi:signal transduction histidine kinase